MKPWGQRWFWDFVCAAGWWVYRGRPHWWHR
jgi:hypothetical protein